MQQISTLNVKTNLWKPIWRVNYFRYGETTTSYYWYLSKLLYSVFVLCSVAGFFGNLHLAIHVTTVAVLTCCAGWWLDVPMTTVPAHFYKKYFQKKRGICLRNLWTCVRQCCSLQRKISNDLLFWLVLTLSASNFMLADKLPKNDTSVNCGNKEIIHYTLMMLLIVLHRD